MIDINKIDIVERLIDWEKGANEILRLRAENEKLREALKPFSNLWLYPDDLGAEMNEYIREERDFDEYANDQATVDVFVKRSDIRFARAVLKGDSDE